MNLRRDVVILACAVSAGIHGALVPEHFAEGMPSSTVDATKPIPAGVLAIVLTLRPAGAPALAGAALVFAGLLVSYALAVTTGFPVLHPEPEPVDGLALATKAFEVVGLLTAVSLLRLPAIPHPFQPKGTLT